LPITLREIKINDAQEATELLKRLDLAMPDTSECIDAHWRRLWIDNPAVAAAENRVPLGWALEKDGEMIGFFCNLLLLYYFGDRQVIVANASQWGLLPQHRAKILQLADPYFNQKNVDILMATTANKAAGRIFRHYGADEVPQTNYNQVLYWITDGAGFVGVAMRKKGFHSNLVKIISSFIGPFVDFGLSIRRKNISSLTERVDLIGVEEIGKDFDDLWLAKRGEAEKLLACRSADCLKWHFGATKDEKEAKILVHRDDRLRGYMIVMREDAKEIGLKRLRIADLFVEADDISIIESLFVGAYDYGRRRGYHVLEWVGMPSNLREIALRQRPLVRTLPTWPLFYKEIDAGLKNILEDENSWYITAYDGDTTLA